MQQHKEFDFDKHIVQKTQFTEDVFFNAALADEHADIPAMQLEVVGIPYYVDTYINVVVRAGHFHEHILRMFDSLYYLVMNTTEAEKTEKYDYNLIKIGDRESNINMFSKIVSVDSEYVCKIISDFYMYVHKIHILMFEWKNNEWTILIRKNSMDWNHIGKRFIQESGLYYDERAINLVKTWYENVKG